MFKLLNFLQTNPVAELSQVTRQVAELFLQTNPVAGHFLRTILQVAAVIKLPPAEHIKQQCALLEAVAVLLKMTGIILAPALVRDHAQAPKLVIIITLAEVHALPQAPKFVTIMRTATEHAQAHRVPTHALTTKTATERAVLVTNTALQFALIIRTVPETVTQNTLQRLATIIRIVMASVPRSIPLQIAFLRVQITIPLQD